MAAANSYKEIRIDAVPETDGPGWRVRAIGPGTDAEYVAGFKTLVEAEAWILEHSLKWLGKSLGRAEPPLVNNPRGPRPPT